MTMQEVKSNYKLKKQGTQTYACNPSYTRHEDSEVKISLNNLARMPSQKENKGAGGMIH